MQRTVCQGLYFPVLFFLGSVLQGFPFLSSLPSPKRHSEFWYTFTLHLLLWWIFCVLIYCLVTYDSTIIVLDLNEFVEQWKRRVIQTFSHHISLRNCHTSFILFMDFSTCPQPQRQKKPWTSHLLSAEDVNCGCLKFLFLKLQTSIKCNSCRTLCPMWVTKAGFSEEQLVEKNILRTG